MAELTIAGRPVGSGHSPYIIAEIGSNHNGEMNLLCELVDAAHECGVDAVKFQSWSKRSLVSQAELSRNAGYARERNARTLGEEIEKYQLTLCQHLEIAEHCRARGVVFFSSCFSREEVDLLESLDAPAFKIASMDVNHLPLLDYVGAKGRPVILSTGLASLGEIERAVSILSHQHQAPLALLHCVSLYPSPPAMVDLRNLATLRAAFGVETGYSDHTLGIAVPVAAVALGATLIEKHFTLDKKMPGWDHSLSADPAEMRALVAGCRDAHQALGSAVRRLNPEQQQKRTVFRRRMVAAKPLVKGHRIEASDLEFKRPGTGIAPDEVPYVLNRVLNRDIEAEEEFEWDDLV